MKKEFNLLILLIVFFGKFSFAQWETVYFPLGSPTYPLGGLCTVQFTNSNKGMAGGGSQDGLIIIRTINNGTTWDTVYQVADTLTVFDLIFTDSVTVHAVGGGMHEHNRGILLKTNDFGTSWDTSYFTKPLYSISFPSENIGYAVGSQGTILKTIDGGLNWNLQSPQLMKYLKVFILLMIQQVLRQAGGTF